MKVVAHVLLGYLGLVVMGALWPLCPAACAAPNLPCVFATYVGVGRTSAATAVAQAVVIGYLADLVCGTPRGIQAVVAGIVCLIARLATSRLLVRGALITSILTAVLAGFAAALILGIRAMYGVRMASGPSELWVLSLSTLFTGLAAVPFYRLLRAVDARLSRSQREREAL